MSKDQKIRILVGTRKGAFVATSDLRRKSWKIGTSALGSADVYHVAADPRHPGTLYAAANSAFWGPMVQRSTDWGKTWKESATPLTPMQKERSPEGDPARQQSRPLANLWHFEPGPASDPDVLYLGADPHLLFRSNDQGESWEGVAGINNHPDRKNWGPGNGGPCLHTVLLDPRDARRMYVGMSSVGTFRSEDGGRSWTPTNKHVECPFLPEGKRFPETGQCVHKVAIDSANPNTFYRQDHGGIYVSHNRMDSWRRIGKPLGDDFGFGVASPAMRPGLAYFVRLDGFRSTARDFQVQEWNDRTRRWKMLVRPNAFPGNFNVLREGVATDALDPPGIYVGTTTGQLFMSPDAGKSWQVLPYVFPQIRSVSVVSPGAS
ncbi:MAG TPA: exo-alpha-sialidase [Thermoplasmata archaeon]|nr:exo-alpha-sialidase [Thermoplasmata archaeon]